MTVQYALETDEIKIEELWRYSFNDTEDFINYYFKERYRSENTLVYKDEKLMAALQMNPYKINIEGQTDPVSYIIGISVFPQHRGRGLTTELLKSALMEEYKNGHSVSLLMPISTPLYTRYGYQNCIDLYSYNIDLSNIELKKTDYKVRRLYGTSEEEFKSLSEIYNKKTKEWDIFLDRDDEDFRQLYLEAKSESGEIFAVYDNKDNPLGYMVFYPKFEPLETGFVRELIALDKKAMDCLFNIIKSHATQIKKVLIYQPENNPIAAYFNYDNKIDIQLKPFMMARVVNAKKVIEKILKGINACDFSLFKFANTQDENNIYIDIEDSLIDKNNKIFRLNFGKNNVAQQALNENSASFILTVHEKSYKSQIPDESCIISMDIGTFSQLYFGKHDMGIMVFNQKIKMKNCSHDFFEILFPKKSSYINEYI